MLIIIVLVFAYNLYTALRVRAVSDTPVKAWPKKSTRRAGHFFSMKKLWIISGQLCIALQYHDARYLCGVIGSSDTTMMTFAFINAASRNHASPAKQQSQRVKVGARWEQRTMLAWFLCRTAAQVRRQPNKDSGRPRPLYRCQRTTASRRLVRKKPRNACVSEAHCV